MGDVSKMMFSKDRTTPSGMAARGIACLMLGAVLTICLAPGVALAETTPTQQAAAVDSTDATNGATTSGSTSAVSTPDVPTSDVASGSTETSKEATSSTSPAAGTTTTSPSTTPATTPSTSDVTAPSGSGTDAAQGSDATQGTTTSADGTSSGTTSEATATTDAADTTAQGSGVVDTTKEYVIESGVAYTKVLDAEGGGSTDGTNVQSYDSNKSGAQRWKFVLNSDGTYGIKNVGSGLYLDIEGAGDYNGANVQLYEPNGTAAQKFTLVAFNGGYKIVSSTGSSRVIDIDGGKTENGANAQIWDFNGSAAQLFYFIAYSPTVDTSSFQTSDGVYEIDVASNGQYCTDASNNGKSTGTNVQICSANNTSAQRYYLSKDADGFYTISCLGSGLVFDVANGGMTLNSNVQLCVSNNTDAQKWSIQSLGNGIYRIVSKLNGLVLDFAGNNVQTGTNVDVYQWNGSGAQKWMFKAISTSVSIDDGYYIAHVVDNFNTVIDVPDYSDASGVQLHLCDLNRSMAQRFSIVSDGTGGYDIEGLCSGKYLVVANGKAVQDTAKASWKLVWNNGFCFTDGTSYLSFAEATSGALLTVANSIRSFFLESVPLLDDGRYNIRSLVSSDESQVLETAGGSYKDRANVWTYANNGTGAQAWDIASAGNGYYTIKNAKSGKALDVDDGSKTSGTNVKQFVSNGNDAQLWSIKWVDGALVLVNKAADNALTVYQNKEASGTNVVSSSYDAASLLTGQEWRIRPSSYTLSGDAALDAIIQNVLSYQVDDAWGAYEYVAGYNYIAENEWPGGDWYDWSRDYAKEMYNNQQGNCYRYASLLAWLLRGLGFDAAAHSGSVGLTSGAAAHGWVEVYQNGQTLVCDSDMHKFWPQYDFFMITYDDVRIYYYL